MKRKVTKPTKALLAPPKRPRGRPRRDGTPAGSPRYESYRGSNTSTVKSFRISKGMDKTLGRLGLTVTDVCQEAVLGLLAARCAKREFKVLAHELSLVRMKYSK